MTGPDFAIKLRGTAAHPILIVSGDLDYRTGPILDERVQAILATQPDCLSLDPSAVSFFASGSIGALVAVQQAADKTRTEFDLINVPRSLLRLLEVVGMADFFRIQPSVDADG